MKALAGVITDVLFRDPALKVLALLLAGILFVLTRDEVTRSFEIPIRIVEDPDRVLMTNLPRSMQVKVRGPWTRVNRLQDYDFGAATLDLRASDPGPLQVDQASIVMPPGVVLAEVQYDHVDLRFDPVISAKVQVTPVLLGEPHPDYRITEITTSPTKWPIRGGQVVVQAVSNLSTEPFEISGAEGTQKAKLSLIKPSGSAQLVRTGDERPAIDVRVVIEPLPETREFTVPVAVPEELDPTGAVPQSYSVTVSGPLPRFRELDALELTFPVEANVVPLDGRSADGGKKVEVRFTWKPLVDSTLQKALSIDHGVEQVVLPPPPATPPPTTPPV